MKGVIIDFGSFFEFGSAYTAISRVKRLEDIKIVSYPVAVMEADYNNEFIYDWFLIDENMTDEYEKNPGKYVADR